MSKHIVSYHEQSQHLIARQEPLSKQVIRIRSVPYVETGSNRRHGSPILLDVFFL